MERARFRIVKEDAESMTVLITGSQGFFRSRTFLIRHFKNENHCRKMAHDLGLYYATMHASTESADSPAMMALLRKRKVWLRQMEKCEGPFRPQKAQAKARPANRVGDIRNRAPRSRKEMIREISQ